MKNSKSKEEERGCCFALLPLASAFALLFFAQKITHWGMEDLPEKLPHMNTILKALQAVSEQERLEKLFMRKVNPDNTTPLLQRHMYPTKIACKNAAWLQGLGTNEGPLKRGYMKLEETDPSFNCVNMTRRKGDPLDKKFPSYELQYNQWEIHKRIFDNIVKPLKSFHKILGLDLAELDRLLPEKPQSRKDREAWEKEMETGSFLRKVRRALNSLKDQTEFRKEPENMTFMNNFNITSVMDLDPTVKEKEAIAAIKSMRETLDEYEVPGYFWGLLQWFGLVKNEWREDYDKDRRKLLRLFSPTLTPAHFDIQAFTSFETIDEKTLRKNLDQLETKITCISKQRAIAADGCPKCIVVKKKKPVKPKKGQAPLPPEPEPRAQECYDFGLCGPQRWNPKFGAFADGPVGFLVGTSTPDGWRMPVLPLWIQRSITVFGWIAGVIVLYKILEYFKFPGFYVPKDDPFEEKKDDDKK